MDFLLNNFQWIKAFHIIAVIAWMAGLLYLPRLFVYHAATEPGSAMSETFKTMERRLLRAIMNPAMIAVYVFGILLVIASSPGVWQDGWWHVKVVLVIAMTVLHMFFARWRRAFAEDRNTRTPRFYKFMNEAPTLVMIAIVLLAVVKPF
ncbi:MAG: protoporphyrinogen oxidase HemJ [Pseudomonadota bacterium]